MELKDITTKLTGRIVALEKKYPFVVNLELDIVPSDEVYTISTNLTSDTKELIVFDKWLETADNKDIDWTLLFLSWALSLNLYEKQKDFDTQEEKAKYNVAAAYFINNIIVEYHDPDLEIANGTLYSETYRGKTIDEIAALLDLNNLIKVKKEENIRE